MREQLQNTVRTITGKSSGCRFSPITTQFPYSLWDSSAAQFRASKAILPLCLPGERQLKRIKQRNKCEDGEDIKAVQMLASQKKIDEIWYSLLYTDEIKVRHGVTWNSQTGQSTGIARDMLDLKSVLNRLVSEEGDQPKAAEYANCWKCNVFTEQGMDGHMVGFFSQ